MRDRCHFRAALRGNRPEHRVGRDLLGDDGRLVLGGRSVDLGSWGILVGILIGAGLGLINGFFIAYVGIPSFMMTLAMLTIAKGLATYVNDGKPIFEEPDILGEFRSAGNLFHGIPVIGIIAAVVLAVGHIVLGLHAIRPAGLYDRRQSRGSRNVRRRYQARDHAGDDHLRSDSRNGRNAPARPRQPGRSAGGPNMLIDTIAAVVLGGTSLFGGEGGMLNTVLGLLIFAVLSNGLNLLPELSIYFKEALTGIILLCGSAAERGGFATGKVPASNGVRFGSNFDLLEDRLPDTRRTRRSLHYTGGGAFGDHSFVNCCSPSSKTGRRALCCPACCLRTHSIETTRRL